MSSKFLSWRFHFFLFQWCRLGKCVPMDDDKFVIPSQRPPLTPVHGGWSAWSELSECSRSCGVGIRWQTRKCNNPVSVLKVTSTAFYNFIEDCNSNVVYRLRGNWIPLIDAGCAGRVPSSPTRCESLESAFFSTVITYKDWLHADLNAF